VKKNSKSGQPKRRAAHSIDFVDQSQDSVDKHRTMLVSYHPIHRHTRNTAATPTPESARCEVALDLNWMVFPPDAIPELVEALWDIHYQHRERYQLIEDTEETDDDVEQPEESSEQPEEVDSDE